MKKLLLTSFVCLLAMLTYAQNLPINGIVIDSKTGDPIIGASVLIKNKQSGTITDFDGRFVLKVEKYPTTIIVKYIGYKSQEYVMKSGKEFTIRLSEDSELLDEVVVVGYGSMKKSDMSGAVASIKSKDLMTGNPSDLSQGLSGKIAGVQINQNDGAPGAGVSIQIRGANSFSTNTQPLFIVDGVPFDAGSTPSSDANSGNNQSFNALNFINPHDIESIEVLKDASATAIYGSRGANGVVLITTKRGEHGHDKVEFSSSFTISKVANRVNMLKPSTYASYINEETLNSAYYYGTPYGKLPYSGTWSYSLNADQTYNYNNGTYNPSPSDFNSPGIYTDEYGNKEVVGGSDWQDEIYQVGFSQEYNLSVSGGSDKGWYAFSGNYLDQSGTIKNSGMKRYSLRSNLGRKINKFLELGSNMSYTNSDTDFAKTSAYDYGVIRSSLIFPTTFAPDMDTTSSDELNWLAANPAEYVKSAKDNLKSINFFSSSYAQIQFLPYLKFRQNVGVSYTSQRRQTYYNRHTQEGKSPVNGKAGQSDSWWQSMTAESLVTFDKTFDKIHHINAVAGFTIEKAKSGYKSMTAANFPNDLTEAYDMSLGLDPGELQSGASDQALLSFLGRVNYTLKDKYIFTTSYRRDGSSKFSENNKWANFLSGAFAWRLSEEKFIKDLGLFSNLKWRVSYGQTGNQAISDYRTIPLLSVSNYPFGGSSSSGFSEVSWRGPVSADLKWETTDQYNVGIDLGFDSNRYTLTADYYYKKTKDLLQEVKIPSSTGFSNMMVNSGHVTNEGLELTAHVDVFRDTPVKWSVDGNLSFNKNKIGGLEADQFANTLWYGADDVFIQRNGCPIGAIYGYVEDGFYDNEAEVRANPLYTNASDATVKGLIGEIKYRNLDDDPKLTESDKTIIGDTNPDYTYGITNTIRWKNLTCSFFLQGSHGNDVFNGNLLDVKMGNIGNIPEFAYNSRWTPATTDKAKWPKAISGYNRTMLISDRYVEDGSYIKLKNINVSYRFDFNNEYISNLVLYASATNLFTITDYSWFDPDVNAFGTDSSRRGVDIYSYPAARTFSLGVKLGF